MKPTGTDDNPAMDAASLQQLLFAAYVVQQHKERLQTGEPPENGYSQILKEILEVQEQLRASPLDLREKAALIARQARQITQAAGSAIGVVSAGRIEYYAATGSAAGQAGAVMPAESALGYECLRTGQSLQSAAAETDPRLNPELCRSLGIKAFIAVPVKHEGTTGGILEVHFADANPFQEQEVRTCQLLSAVVAEAILKPLRPQAEAPAQRNPTGPADWPANLQDTESLLATLEKIRPKLERMARGPEMGGPGQSSAAESPLADGGEAPAPASTACRDCGHLMEEDEIFCGLCGSPRQTRHIWSSLWQLQRKAERSMQQDSAAGDDGGDPLEVFPSELEEIIAKFSTEPFEEHPPESVEVRLPSFAEELTGERISLLDDSFERESSHARESSRATEEESPVANQNELTPAPTPEPPDEEAGRPFLIERASEQPSQEAETYPPFAGFASETSLLSLTSDTESEPPVAVPAAEDPVPAWSPNAEADGSANLWGSAAKAKEWLDVQRANSGWLAKKWQQQRANVYLVAAAVLLGAVLLGWGAPSPSRIPVGKAADPAGAQGKNPVTQPDLTLSDRLLISLGLAEVPSAEVAQPGNPDAKVWIDVHTALYYCHGDELYGKTPGGKTTTQLQAQQDQFQPAMRKACN